MQHINRYVISQVRHRLEHFDCVALLGPRQTGKTTLARAIADEWESGSQYLDLETPADRIKLGDIDNGQADKYLDQFERCIVVLDEIQKVPKLFEILRGQIDRRRRAGVFGGKFLVLGSASMDLLRQTSESLAGRISYVELFPLRPDEILDHMLTIAESINVDAISAVPADVKVLRQKIESSSDILDRSWLRGGFPLSFLRPNNDVSFQWRADFIKTYIERDIPQFDIDAASEKFAEFWTILSTKHGELFVPSNIGKGLQLKVVDVEKYVKTLVGLLLVRKLEPWASNFSKRLTRSPRLYVRDSGILHALLGIRTLDELLTSPKVGKSWEGFVIESLVNSAGVGAKAFFYRSADGRAEADLILELPGNRIWAIEIKLNDFPKVTSGLHAAANDLGAARRLLVYRGNKRMAMNGNVEAMPLDLALAEVREAVKGAS